MPDRDATVPGRVLPVWRFFLISHGISWVCWFGAIAWAGSEIWSAPARWLVYAGGTGPLVAGIVMTWVTSGRRGLRELLSRVFDPGRVPLRWFVAALGLPVLAMAAAVGVAARAGALPDAVDASQLSELASAPLLLGSFALVVLVFGPIPEEVGWRGYALDALQSRVGPVTASLVLGAAWALWHAPLFLIAGYYRGGPPDPVQFTAAILVHSVLYTWIYNHTRRSILVAIAFHFMINFVGMLVDGVAWVEWLRTAFTAIVALLAIANGLGVRSRHVASPAPGGNP
jgi:uncharacterized protein